MGVMIGRVSVGRRHMFSSGCSGKVELALLRRSCAMSQAVSDAEQKKAGDLHHPIWRHKGTTIMGSSPGLLGRT